jgi:anhydro-N-acetylmuramic acid kinase
MALYAGIMSGTSLDGVDVAFAEIDVLDPSPEAPKFRVKPAGAHYEPYPDDLRSDLHTLRSGNPRPVAEVSRLHFVLAERYTSALLAGAKACKINLSNVEAVGLHGQTVWHNPPSADDGIPNTLQIGSPAVLAERARVAVVSDFRAADIAAVGEGAPLIPFVDYILLSSPTEIRAVLNIGGIANVTFLPMGGQLQDTHAFDTGPGNMIIDAVVFDRFQGAKTYDKDGAMAATGVPNEPLLTALLSHPYFHKAPPKSTGAELFGPAYARNFISCCKGLRRQNVLATATMLTARSIAESFRFLPGRPDRLILGGGGAHNATLVGYLSDLMPGVAISMHSEFGLDGDSKEALAFAILAAAHIHRIPANIPEVTGARRSCILGSYTPAPI